MKFFCRLKPLMFLLLCSGAFGARAGIVLESSDKYPFTEIRNYIDKSDTNGLSAALLFLNVHYNRYHGQELLDLLRQGEEHSHRTDMYGLYGFYSLIRRYYEEEGNSSKAMEYALKCYNLLKNEPESSRLYWLMIDIGNIFYDVRDFNQAQVFYEQALGIANRLKEAYGLSVIHLNLGLVAYQKKEYGTALKSYKLSARYRITSGNEKFVSTAYTNIANTFFRMNLPDSALHYTNQAKYYYENFGEDNELLVYIPAYIELGYYQYYATKKNFAKADAYLRRAKEYAYTKNLQGIYVESFFVEASCLMHAGLYEDAIRALKGILPRVKEKRLKMNEKDIYKLLSDCYHELHRYEDASNFFQDYIHIQDSMENVSMQAQFNTIRAVSEVHENEMKLNQMRKDMEISHLNSEMERKEKKVSLNIAAFAVSGFLVLSFLMWQFVRRGKKLQKMQFKLMEQNNNIKIQSNELRKSNQIKDKIFSVIAHDLRNPLNRLLVELALIKQQVQPGKTNIVSTMENTLKETIDLFERLLEWSKRDNKQIVYSPTILNLSESVNKVITFYISDIQTNKIAIVNNCSTLHAFVDANVFLTLVRNILGNAIKAVGPGGTIEIQCAQVNEKDIEIVFSDSGSGFSQYILNEFNNDSKVESVGEGTGLMLCKMLAKYNDWPIRLSNDSAYGGARITLVIPAYRKKIVQLQEDAGRLQEITIPADMKERLEPIKKYKFYQTSELRQLLHNIETEDPGMKEWIRNVLSAIHEGNEEAFRKLVQMV